jgi:hypothetical protein
VKSPLLPRFIASAATRLDLAFKITVLNFRQLCQRDDCVLLMPRSESFEVAPCDFIFL